MGEDRTTCTEKRSNDVLPCRHRHSSVISSSCSEDAESETTSAGYPPTPDEDRDEELEYGPGIVNKLRTRFLTITLKQNRGTNMRRFCSLENLLDQEGPLRNSVCQKRIGDEQNETKTTVWGELKRAKSMDTLLMDLKSETTKDKHSETNGDVKKELKIVRRRDASLNRIVPIICDDELPKPDTVKTYKRIFEPAESRRGSHSRRPPVLRASAKSGALTACKINGISPTSSAKVNGTVMKGKFSAKQSPPIKAQPTSEPATCPVVLTKPVVNGDVVKPMCNGSHTVKATPIKIGDRALCNGKNTEKELNLVNHILSKNELNFGRKADIICNGNSVHKEVIKKLNADSLSESNKNTGSNVIGGINSKPKVPPNRPNFVKNTKPVSKLNEQKVGDKRSPVISKLKSNLMENKKTPPETVKREPEKPSPAVSRLKNGNKEVSKENVIKEEAKLTKENAPKSEDKILEENNRKNVEKSATDSVLKNEDKLVDMPVKKLVNGFQENANSETGDKIKKFSVDSNKTKISKPETRVTDVKPDIKPVKKTPSSPATSMVFDFRGKDVVPHVAVLPVPFGCKAMHPKKRPLLIDGKETPNGNGVASDDEDDDFVDYSVPPPCGVVFEGENVKIGRGSILSTRNKDLKIAFDDEVDKNTFIYPSESSLLEESESSLSPTPSDEEIVQNGQPPLSKLKTNTSIGSSGAGGLSTYTPSVLRTMDNFQPGMFRPPPAPVLPEKEEEKCKQNPEEEENTQVQDQDNEDQEMLKPADPEVTSSWSLSAGTSDLLF